ncbi:MAG: hypothetical protein E7399_07805 [Ruminococcaceae bacterium]|nr:hypothetical protein [Oscillospiraceae bacterium]
MKSKKVFCNTGILRSDFRRLWWAPVLMTLLEFLVHPMELINAYHFDGYSPDRLYNDLAVVYFVYPILVGALLFRYLHTSKSIQFFHTLPVTRGQLFRTKILTFWMFILIPVLVNWGSMLLIYPTAPYSLRAITPWEIHELYLTILCGQAAMCGFTLFAVTITGNTAGMILGTIALPFLPLVLFILTTGLLEFTLIGYTASDENFLTYLIPFIRDDIEYMRVYLTEWLVLQILASIFYRNYKAEATGDLITVKWLRPIFLYGVCYCSTILGIAYAFNYEFGLAGYLISSFVATFIGFAVAESLLQRTIRIIGSWKKLLCYLVISFAVIIALKFDVIGYESNIPELSEVESVQFSYQKSLSDDYYGTRGGAILTEPENIQKVIEFHQQAAKKETDSRYWSRYLIYQLKDGSQLKRHYSVPNDKEIADIINTEEYKRKYYPIFDMEDFLIVSANISETMTENSFTLYDIELCKQLEEAVKKDLLEQDVTETTTFHINFEYSRRELETEINPSNSYDITNGTHVKAFLEKYKSNQE